MELENIKLEQQKKEQESKQRAEEEARLEAERQSKLYTILLDACLEEANNSFYDRADRNCAKLQDGSYSCEKDFYKYNQSILDQEKEICYKKYPQR